MISRQSGLGRGLGALIPDRRMADQSRSGGDMSPLTQARDGRASVQEISLDLIDPNPHQPRRHFDHNDLEDLVASIKEHGLLQPIVVTRKPDGRYELIVGERRLRASKIAGLETIAALVRNATDQQKMELAIIENVQRADLNPVEEAYAYLRLQDEFGLTQDEVGIRVGKSRPQVANIIRLLQLPEEIQRALIEKKISTSNARTLLSLPTEEERLKMFRLMIEGNFTVRQTEARVPHPRRRVSGAQDANVAALENQLRDALAAKVIIKRDIRGEGEIRVRFFSDEDLDGIVRRMLNR